MPSLYEITYLPWKDNTEGKPFLYSGSDWNDNPKYFGSVHSKEWKEFWKSEIRDHPEHFQKDIIMTWTTNEITQQQLREIESAWQYEEQHAESKIYFNKTNRMGGSGGGFIKNRIPWNKGKVGVMPEPWNKGRTNVYTQLTINKIKTAREQQVFKPRTQEQKDKMKNKVWINNPSTQKNKRVDLEILDKWINDGWVKGRGSFTPHNAQDVTINDVTYSSITEAAQSLGTNPESLRQRLKRGKNAKPQMRGSWASKAIIIDGVWYPSKKAASAALNTTSLNYWIKTGKVNVEYPEDSK